MFVVTDKGFSINVDFVKRIWAEKVPSDESYLIMCIDIDGTEIALAREFSEIAATKLVTTLTTKINKVLRGS